MSADRIDVLAVMDEAARELDREGCQSPYDNGDALREARAVVAGLIAEAEPLGEGVTDDEVNVAIDAYVRAGGPSMVHAMRAALLAVLNARSAKP